MRKPFITANNIDVLKMSVEDIESFLIELPIEIYRKKLTTSPQKTFKEMQEFKGFRIETIPKDRIIKGLLNNYKKKGNELTLFIGDIIATILVANHLDEVIFQYQADDDINKFYTKITNQWNEGKSRVQPALLIRIFSKPSSKIEDFMLKELDLPKSDVVNEIQESPVAIKNPIVTPLIMNDHSETRELKRLKEVNERLERQIDDQKTKHNDQLALLQKEFKNAKEKVKEELYSKTMRIMSVSINDEFTKLIKNKKSTNFDELWQDLSKLENELYKSDKETRIKDMQTLLTMKYALLTSEEIK